MIHTDEKTLAQNSVTAQTAEESSYASCPLTPMQTGLIYESVMVDKPWINLEQIVCHLNDERMDADTLHDAWLALAQRHEVLRCVFRWQGLDRPVQVVLPEAHVDLKTSDLSDRTAEAQEQAIADWLKGDRDRGVDMVSTPGWHLHLFRLGARKSVLVWTFHHALLDGRGWTLLLREVLDDYTARMAGDTEPARAQEGAGFSDYCRQLDALSTNDAKTYFEKELAGFDAANRISLEPAAPASTGADERKRLIDTRLPVEFGDALVDKAKTSGTSVATLVLAAWGLVVARCSNREDAVIGVVRSGRYVIKDTSKTAGCLINTLPTRIKTTPDLTIDQLLQAVRHGQKALQPFEHASLADTGTWAEVPAGNSLFETSVMFDRGTLGTTLNALGGIWATRRFELLEEGALPLTLAVYQDPNMLCRLEYNPARYTHASAQRLLGYLTTLLRNFTMQPGDTTLSQVQMLAEGEMSDVLDLAAPPCAQPFAPTPCLVERFEQIAQQHGTEISLSQIGVSGQLTFGELDQRANQLAQRLCARSIGPGDLVALCLPRSVEYVVAMLAVMKSGAAFLPIDPSYPAASIAHMLTDSAASLILTTSRAQPDQTDAPLLLLDLPIEPASQGGTAPKRVHFDPERTAYVIYTSGSTGLPKGVPISHRALSHHVTAITDAFEITPKDRALQFASLSFDVSLEEILPTLLAGGQVILRDGDMAESMGAFFQACDQAKVTVLNLPTAFWHILVDHMELTGARLPSSVRLLVVGGEAISRSVLERFRAMSPDLRCLNGYGTTEATITSTLYDTALIDTLAPGEDVPVGRPLPHARAYVLCPDGAFAPRGGAGSLWLGGPAISAGYLNRPALNAAKFRADPYSPAKDHMYQSGDMVRWREDGALAFAGRSDRQVKVNGYRIELREVEKALEAIDTVGLALAAVTDPGTPQARLAAWVTPEGFNKAPTPEALLKQLSQVLPAYMLPAICVVPSFPKTPGDKVDLAALPHPTSVSPSAKAQADSDDPVVAFLCASFAELLGVDHVGPDMSFFDLGGHSLLAVRLIGRIEARFNQRLSIAALRNEPTPSALARMLAEGSTTEQNTSIVAIQPNGNRTPLFGVHVLGENEMFFRPLAQALGPDQPLLGLTVGLLTKDSPTSVKDTAERYLTQIQKHYPKGPVALAAVSQGSFIAFELAQQLRKAGREVTILALFDAFGPAGRESLRSVARIRMHLQLLHQNGLGYLQTMVRNRAEKLRNAIEKRRVKALGLGGRKGPSVNQFVAANTLAIEAYKAQPYDGPIALFRAKDSVFDTPETIANALGWRPVAAGSLVMQEVPGGHLSMLQPPHVQTLAARLTNVMDRKEP